MIPQKVRPTSARTTTHPFAITYRYKRARREHEEIVMEVTARAAVAKFVEQHANDEDTVVLLHIAGVD